MHLLSGQCEKSYQACILSRTRRGQYLAESCGVIADMEDDVDKCHS